MVQSPPQRLNFGNLLRHYNLCKINNKSNLGHTVFENKCWNKTNQLTIAKLAELLLLIVQQ